MADASLEMKPPRIIVFCSLFPSAAAPTSGTFIRERMFRVAKRLPIVVVAPQAWSPFDGIVRLFRPSFRPVGLKRETMDGIEVHRPRYFSMPGWFKRCDGRFMARAVLPAVRRIHERFGATLIDAHFLYPDGWAAVQIGKELDLPVTITIRGSKDEWLIDTDRERYLIQAMRSATKLFAVSESLKHSVAVRLGIAANKVAVIGNGVDLNKFTPCDQREARARLDIPVNAKVIVGVGGLIERKGFHRVIPLISNLRKKYPSLIYLIVGGGTTQGDMTSSLMALARDHHVLEHVRFCGPQKSEELKWFYSAADVFVLATEHEGWANVFLEAMACGLPIVTTDVGGNAEVIPNRYLGVVTQWWRSDDFCQAIDAALARDWDHDVIVDYAKSNTWDNRIERLISEFETIVTI